MVLLNIIMIVIENWICIVVLIGRYAQGSFSDSDISISDWEMRQMRQLEKKLNLILNSPVESQFGETQKLDVAKRRSLKSKLIEGFFGDHRRPTARNNKKSLTMHHNENTNFVKNPSKMIFGTEKECESVNDGRPCVCLMTDFLDSVCQHLEESAIKPMDENMAMAFECPSYKPVSAAFVISPESATSEVTKSAAVVVEKMNVQIFKKKAKINYRGIKDTVVTATWKRVNFDNIINYQIEKPKNDNYAVHYVLIGSDYKVNCLIDDDIMEMDAFNWNYKKSKHKTNSIISGTDTSQLMISRIEPGDSKNYTCMSKGNSRNTSSFTHYIIAVDKPIYEIRGTAFYKSNDVGGCRLEIIKPVHKQLPNCVQTEICPEGSSRYACNVVIDTLKCIKDNNMLEVKYLVTLNKNAGYLTRIKTSRKDYSALSYQKLLAKISKVLDRNLNKSLAIEIMSKLSLINTNFEPVYSLMKMTKFVSCPPGFGIREVFCGACPPHHYSPDKSTECLKCPKWFHQPVAGSENCVKCPNLFASGCFLEEVSLFWYFIALFIMLIVCFIFISSCVCGCCEENKNTKVKPQEMHTILKKSRKSASMTDCSKTTTDSYEPEWQKFGKFHKLVNYHNKPQYKKMKSKVKFDVIHSKVGEHFLKNWEQDIN